MKINIVTVSSGWILQKIAQRIHNELQKMCEATISHEPNLFADVNFYVDVQNCYHHKTNTLDRTTETHLIDYEIIFFTHRTVIPYFVD